MFLGLRWGRWSSSVKGMTSCTSVFWAVGCSSTSSAASLAVSEVGGAVWVLAVVQIDVLGVVTAGVATVVGGDMAVAFSGSRCGTGVNGVGWGEQGGVERLLGLHLGFWGMQDRSIEQTTCSGEHVCMDLCNGVA